MLSQHHQAHGLPARRVAAVKTYSVRAERWEHGWELHIDGLGVTQSDDLDDAEMMVRDYISLDLGVPPDSFAVDIIPEPHHESRYDDPALRQQRG